MSKRNPLIALGAILLLLISVPGMSASAFGHGAPGQMTLKGPEREKVAKAYGNLPLYFIRNDGQMDEQVFYYERSGGHSMFFTHDGVHIALNDSAETSSSANVKLTLVGGNPSPELVGESPQQARINYFIGNDKTRWRTNVPTFGSILYREVYPGIDVRFYGNNRQLEYDVIVGPGRDPSAVRFRCEGAEHVRITEAGELEIAFQGRTLLQKRPYVYQVLRGKKVEIPAAFLLLKGDRLPPGSPDYGFHIASHDPLHPLIIDPAVVELAYSTYLGGADGDYGYGIAVDAAGNAYIAGHTYSTNFPTQNPFQGTSASGNDAFVTKLEASGSALVYSTYLGGDCFAMAYGIAVDDSGNAYVTGYTCSSDFPTQNPFQSTLTYMYDAFVTKLDASGSALVYSTYLGGSGDYDIGRAIAVDASGYAHVTGETTSSDFPTQNPFQGASAGGGDAFVTKLDISGSALAYSTYLGGSAYDYGHGIAVDASGYAYLTGYTDSTDFPTQNPFQGASAGGGDAFVTKLDAPGSSLIYSTYLGGSNSDGGYGIAVDTSAYAYLTGYTESTDFPTQNPFQGASAGGSDAFVTKLDAPGSSLIYSTYLGGNLGEHGNSIAVDNAANAYVTGTTASNNFPTQDPYQETLSWYSDLFLTKLNASGSALDYSTYLGGTGYDCGNAIAVDALGNAYVTGYTDSANFPTQNPFQEISAGGNDALVAKLQISSSSPTHYVSPSGSDETGDGSEGNPWRTIGKAVSMASAGDTIEVLSDGSYSTDDYFENVVVDKPLIIQSYYFNITAPRVKSADSSTVFLIQSDGVTIDGLEIYGAAGEGDEAGIYIDNRTGCTLSNNICGWDSTTYWNDVGILVYGGGGNRLWGNSLWENGTGISIQGGSEGNTISYNNLGYNSTVGVDVLSGSNNVISGNTFEMNTSGVGIGPSCMGNEVAGNTIRSVEQGIGFLASGNRCYFNTLETLAGSNVFSSTQGNLLEPATKLAYWYNYELRKAPIGNYYGDYGGTDTDGDGIGDMPYLAPNCVDNYPLINIADQEIYQLDTWFLSNPVMYKHDMSKIGALVTISAGSSQVWPVHEAVRDFIAGSEADQTSWTGRISFATAPALNDQFTVEVGLTDDDVGTNFQAMGPQTVLTGDGFTSQFSFATNAQAFALPDFKCLAVRISAAAGNSGPFAVRVGGSWSYVSAPVETASGGTISGTIFRSDGVTPITGVEIRVEAKSGDPCNDPVGHGYVDINQADGTYTFSGLPAGTYFLKSDTYENYLDMWYSPNGSTLDCALAQSVQVEAGQVVPGIDFQLLQEATVSGTVRNSSGEPITGTEIMVIASTGDPCGTNEWQGSADVNQADGAYTIRGLQPATNYHLETATQAGYLNEWWGPTSSSPLCENAGAFALAEGENTTGKGFQLDREATISGTVFKGDGITPITDTEVCVNVITGDPCGAKEWVTNACTTPPSADYVITKLPAGTYYLETGGQELYQNEWWADPNSSPDCQNAMPITVGEGDTPTGRNFQLDGPSVAIISMSDTQRKYCPPVVAADGSAVINLVEITLSSPQQVHITWYVDGQIVSDYNLPINASPHFHNPFPLMSSIALQKFNAVGVRTIKIEVRDTSNNLLAFDQKSYEIVDCSASGASLTLGTPTAYCLGSPPATIPATFTGDGSGSTHAYWSDESGNWLSVTIPEGPFNAMDYLPPAYYSIFDTPGFHYLRLDAPINSSSDVYVSDTVVFNVGPCPPTITSFSPTSGTTGTVVIITGTNFTGTDVTFGGTPAASFTVDSTTQITAVVGSGSSGKVTVTTEGGAANSSSDFTFIASQTAITGTVTDPFGDPVEGATVCAQPYTSGGQNWWCDTTGPDGTYSIAVEPGYARVQASGGGYLTEYYDNAYDGNWASPVGAIDGQTVSNIDFLMGVSGSISGQILTANPGTPLADVCVYAYRQQCATNAFASASTDVNGNYTIANLPPQTYYLRTHAACATPQRYQREWYSSGGGTLICDQAEGVSVASGQTTWDIDFFLDPSDIRYPGPSFRAAGVYSSRIAGGAADSQFYAFINGPSLEDIVSVKAIGPSGTYNLSLVQLPFIELGNFYYHTVSGSVVSEGAYTFVATDSLGRTATVERSFTYNSTMPVVDAASMKVNDKGNQAYAETATPTLSWGAVTWPGTPGYYQVLIYDYDGKAIWHAPTIDDGPTPSVTVPAGILQPDTAYYWLVRTMDIPATGQRGQNRHSSGIRYFYTGTKGFPDVSDNYFLSYSAPIGKWSWFGVTQTGLAPWDIQLYSVTGPEGNVYTYRNRNYMLWGPMYYYCASNWPPPTPDGAYTFLLEDNDSTQDAQLINFTYNPPPPIPEASRSPEDNAYLYTKTPTFSWTAPAAENAAQGATANGTTYYYQLRILDYYSRLGWYMSPTLTETSFTLPEEVVAKAPPGSYRWQVRIFNGPSGLDESNAVNSSDRTFTIPPLADYIYTLPGGTGVGTDYRMFTIPLYLGTGAEMLDRMEAALGPYNPYEWRAFAYDGVGYIEMSTSAFDALQIVPGMAFWIISLDPPQQVPLTGGAVPETTYALDLKGDSWHMIGLPWAGTAIDLANIAVTDGTNTYAITDGDNPLTGHVMWEYTGTGLYSGYEMRGAGDTLTPGTGYFFLITSPTDVTLLIPPDNAGGYFSFSVLSEKGAQNRKLNSVYEEPPPSPPGARPIPDITVNGRDGSVTAVSGNPVSVSVTLDPGAWAGQDVDWWIGAHTPFAAPYDWYSYVYPQGWQSGIHRFIKTPLFEIASPFEVFNMPLSAGEYTFYFAVDNNADGAADLTWMDSVGVKVEDK